MAEVDDDNVSAETPKNNRSFQNAWEGGIWEQRHILGNGPSLRMFHFNAKRHLKRLVVARNRDCEESRVRSASTAWQPVAGRGSQMAGCRPAIYIPCQEVASAAAESDENASSRISGLATAAMRSATSLCACVAGPGKLR